MEVVVTAQEFGGGISQLTGLKMGKVFFPYRIIRSSYRPPEVLRVSLDPEPMELRIIKDQATDDDVEGRRYQFSTKEIIQAVALAICLKQYRPFKASLVSTLPAGVPERLEFELEYIPRGSLVRGFLHEFRSF